MRRFGYAGFLLFCLVLCAVCPVSSYAADYVLDTGYDSASASDIEDVFLASDSNAIMPYGSYSDVYEGSISTTVTTYMRGIVSRFSPAVHYVLFRQSQYTYRLVYGKNLSVSGSRFTGTECDYVLYDSRYSQVSSGAEGDFSLNANSYMVYTDLESMYPVLSEGVSKNEGRALLFCFVVYFLYTVCKVFFSVGRRSY